MIQTTMRKSAWRRLFLLLFMLFIAVSDTLADGYITDLIVLGASKESDANTIKGQYRNGGWTVLDKDLNDGSGGYFIYLGYKTSTTANPETGYVTDIVASTNKKDYFSEKGKTYYRVSSVDYSNKGFDGDLNFKAGGAYIYLYYTCDRANLSGNGGQKRVISSISSSSSSNGTSVQWYQASYGGAADMNADAGGDFIYLNMNFTTQTLSIKTHPSFASNLTYNGASQMLIPNTPSDNNGTMKYRVNNGGWSTNLPSATYVGNYKVDYYLEAYYANSSSTSSKTVTINPPVTTPKNLNGVFKQKEKQIVLTWNGNNLAGNYTDYWWEVYRGNTKIATLEQNVRTFTDTGYSIDNTNTYEVYYVSKFWGQGTKRSDSKAAVTVNANRKVPLSNTNAESRDDRIVLTWNSDGYPQGWGNLFKVYVDNTLVCTITPKNNQTKFQWEHRYKESLPYHSDDTQPENGVPYTEATLNGCSPHNYRIEGYIGDKKFSEKIFNGKAVQNGTQFKSFDATKGAYAGIVKLSWQMILGTTDAKTYIVDRKRAEKDEEWTTLYRTSSTDEYLSFTDDTPLPGIYYDYRVTVEDRCSDGAIITNENTDIGFAQTTGTMSGRITFGATGSSVANVDVEAKRTGTSSDSENQYHSMRFTGEQGAVTWTYPSTTYVANKLAQGNFTIQLWVNPEALGEAKIIRLNGETCYVGMDDSGQLTLVNGETTYTFANAVLKAGQYNHVVLTRSGTTVTASVVGADEAVVPILNGSTQTLDGSLTLTDAAQLTLGHFVGYLDEFRFWTKALSDDEILENYDHLLVGNEKQLETYWTFDEGLRTQFFDYSRDGTVYHQHHGKTGSNAEPSNLTPTELKLKAKTDRDGNYIIQGVPFSGEGTTYAVIPHLGIHQFNPTQQLRFVSNNSLVHNGTDFTDISSFTVRGKIRYANTDYPVEGVQFYVDGQICAKEGKPIITDVNGEYIISVPIGDHYITMQKQGHEFANGGRYPADPNNTGTLVNYNDSVSNLDFEDVTLVTVAGRVTGGKIEEEKPLGFGQSVNNIGQATITLGIDGYRLNVVRNVQGTTVSYDSNSDNLSVSSPTDDVKSTTYRQGGDVDAVKKIVIKTDPQTGEFAALLPPIDYRVESIKIESNQAISFDNLPTLYASDPTQTSTDSLVIDGEPTKKFEYVAKMIKSYYTDPVLEVTQKDRTDGSFGESTYTYTNPKTQEKTELVLYTAADGAPVSYAYGYPIFQQMKQYTFNIRGYETYVNNDDAENPVTYEVPLQNVPITFSNQMGTGQAVVMDATQTANSDDKDGDLADEAIPDKLTLDENGEAQYLWQAGFPNITSPYTRTLAATYTHNDKSYTWTGANVANALSGIVIGALPTGSNFVTNGPDKVEMIIRDPAGTGSSAFWETGQSVTQTETQTITVSNETEAMTHTEFGVELTSLMAAGVGVIVGVITTTSEKATLDVGVKTEYEHVSADTRVLKTSTTKRVSTSGEPEYVGAQGDVFVGQSTNIVYGNARTVGFKKDAQTGNIGLDMFNNYVTGQEFETHFHYTQNYIENVLIPQFISFRNDILDKGVDEQGLLYSTNLTEDDDNYGTTGTYTITKPEPATKEVYVDMVKYYNEQIANWERQLAWNEQMKVQAIDNRRTWLVGNQSFDSGTFIDSEVSTEGTVGLTTSNTFNTSLIIGGGTSVSIFGQDVDISLQNTTKAGSQWESSTETTNTTTTGYSLVELGDDDALSVDVFRAPDGMGAIFVTRGGQTTCPYEGEQRTKYYEPGKHVLATATMQIEIPKIAVENAANHAVGVPAGKKASYNLLLTNESETGEDCYFDLFPIDETNTAGAKLSINGEPFGNGRAVLVPAGGTVRMELELAQNNTGGLIYEDIAIVLSSQCQKDPASTWEVIGDTVLISAEFVPSSTDVTLNMENTVVNTSTKGMLSLTVKDYDPNYDGLKYIAVQYQGVGETAWHDARKYMKNEGDIQNPQIEKVLPIDGIINLNFDMTNSAVFPDRMYKFRALSARTYGTGEITRSSQEIQVVKDMSRPKPLGQPQPTDGILSAGDELSILFNETILNGELTKDKNFRVTGVLNGSEVAHQTALELQNTAYTAATEANINLGGKDFSIDTWINVNGAGTLLSHGTGTNKLIVGVDADNKLTVKIGAQTYTSLNNIPQNQWTFLTLSLSAGGKLSASAAAGSETITLFSNKETTVYEGNGPIVVGQQMTGAMHELLLWDEVRDVATALQQRSVTKSSATQGLIGYWKMDEGEGNVITDYARNRHMAMAAETWHIENENKAVTLDGSHYMAINTSEIPPLPQDDYAVELWVKAGEQTSEAQLLQLGEVGLSLTADGQLQLESNNSQLSIVNSQLNDNVWHHVALSVLRGGNANIYVDGVEKATVSADKVGSLGSDMLLIGARRTLQDVQQSEVLYTYDRQLKATIDEVRIWKATMSAKQLKKQRKVRLTGAEPGLVAYYPFESKTLNAQNQIVTNGSPADLCGSGYDAQLLTLNSELCTMNCVDNAPALRVKPEEENVNFTFTASDNKIVITIDEEPARVEGCTLNFTICDVHDQNGNLSEPVTWSAFVNQNPLMWKESTIATTTQVTVGATLTATLVNKSGKEQVWTMSALPTWLTADIVYGSLLPLAEQTITFTVSESIPIGKYERTIYIAGNSGIETPLTLNITVTGNVPDWAVNPHSYESSMNIIGVLKNNGTYMTDSDDLLGAFVGEECRGLAHPVYNERYGNYYVTMDIYGSNGETGKEVTFRAYDASTGTLYPVVKWNSDETFEFVPLVLAGTYADPVEFNVKNLIEQQMNLKAGWNWVSFYVSVDDRTIPELFKDVADDVVAVKNQTSSIMCENNTWSGNLTGHLSNTEMYAVNMKADRKLRIVGNSVNPSFTIYKGWNWIGYYGLQVASLGDALADMEKTDGDLLKAQRGIAYWDVHSWSGSLQMMQPGLGYQLKAGGDDQIFSYGNIVAGVRQYAPRLTSSAVQVSSNFSPVNIHLYPDNAIMAAKVVANGQPVGNVELAVFAGDECRTTTVTNNEGIAYITIPGDEICELTFKAAVGDEIMDLPLTLTYETDAIYSTPMHPMVIDLGNATGIWNVPVGTGAESIYDLSGRKVRLDNQTHKLNKGVYIINGQKKIVK